MCADWNDDDDRPPSRRDRIVVWCVVVAGAVVFGLTLARALGVV